MLYMYMHNTQPILGTNPISLAAPGLHGDSFVLDMATSTAALGKVYIFNNFLYRYIYLNHLC